MLYAVAPFLALLAGMFIGFTVQHVLDVRRETIRTTRISSLNEVDTRGSLH